MKCFDSLNHEMVCDPSFPWSTLLWIILALIVAIVGWYIVAYPIYNVWASQKRGEAELAEANYEQQIQIAQARGRKDAATLNKEAAIIEAEAVKAQINTIGESLKTHDLYLRWQWIDMMRHRDNGSTIYVPTEANLPILEAVRNAKS